MSDYTVLIAKLEAAEAGSRELDAEILWCADEKKLERLKAAFNYWRKGAAIDQAVIDMAAPHYTFSVDAAMKLVPSGYVLHTMRFVGPKAWAFVACEDEGLTGFRGYSVCAPIAICIPCVAAISRARAAAG